MDDLPVILKDSREKDDHGYNFIASANCAGMEVIKLDYGDYAIKGHLNLITIERKKTVTELCLNLGKNRNRFIAEIERMVRAGCKRKYVVVEDYYSSIFNQRFSKIPPNTLLESINSLSLKYNIHFIFAGNKAMAHKIVRSLLLKAYKYRDVIV